MNEKTLKKRVDEILLKAIASYAGNCWWHLDDMVQACYAGISDFDIGDAMRSLGFRFDHPDSDVLYAAAQEEAKKRAGDPVAEYREGCGGDALCWQVFADGSMVIKLAPGRTHFAPTPITDATSTVGSRSWKNAP